MRIRGSKSELIRRLVSGASWSICGSVASSGINLVGMIFVARLLGKDVFGQFVIVQSTLVMFGVIAGFGIGATATRYVAELRLRDPEKLSHILALTEGAVLIFGLASALGLALMSKVLATVLLNSPGLTLPLAIASVSVFFSALDGYQKSTLIGLEAMRPLAIGSVIGVAASIPIMLLSAHMFGLLGVAGGMSVSALIQCVISKVQVAEQLRLFALRRKVRGCAREWRTLRDFALPALVAGALIAPAHWACHTMLVNTTKGYAELAVMGVAMQWFNAVMFIPSLAGRVVLPVLTDRLAAGDPHQAAKVLQLAILANLAVATPIALGIAIASPWIMSAYGAEFREGSKTLILAALVAVLVVGAMPVSHVLAAGNRMWTGVIMNFGWAGAYLCFSVFLVDFGALGIVLSMGLAYLVHSIWVGAYTIKYLADSRVIQP